MEFALSLKQARQIATRDALVGGSLELGTAGMGVVMGIGALGRGEVNGENLTIPVEGVLIKTEGLVAAARIRAASQVAVITDLIVGDEGTATDIVLGFRKLGPGAVVSLGTITIPHP